MHPEACCCPICREYRQTRGDREVAVRTAFDIYRDSKIRLEGEIYVSGLEGDSPCGLDSHEWSEWGTVSTLPKGWIYRVCSKCGKTYRKRIEKGVK